MLLKSSLTTRPLDLMGLALNFTKDLDKTDDTLGNFLSNVAINGKPGPTTNLKYPDRNVLPILIGNVPKHHCSKLPGKIVLSCSVYHQPKSLVHDSCISLIKNTAKMLYSNLK